MAGALARAAAGAAVVRAVARVRDGALRPPPLAVAAFARGRAAAPFFAVPAVPVFARPRAGAAASGDAASAALVGVRAARLRVVVGLAAARAFARAGVSLAPVAAGAPARAGRSRLALRRAGRVRGRLVRTSRSLPLASESVGGMARLCPMPSGAPPRWSTHTPGAR